VNVGWLLPTHTALVTGRPDPRPLLELAAAAEAGGVDAIWLADSPLAAGLHDPLLMLAAVAARTDRVELGTGLLLAALRQPVLLAQSLASLDAISGGRLVAGLGGGFASPRTAHQFAAAGADYVRRAAALEETIDILRLLWSSPGRPASYSGRHYRFADVVLSPAPFQPGGPPIWLAGAGEQAEARVGRVADGWLPYPPEPESFTASARRVEQAAAQAGRARPRYGLYLTVSFDTDAERAQRKLVEMVERWYGAPYGFVASIQAMYAGPLEGFADGLAPYLAGGVERLVLRSVEADPVDALAAVLGAAPVLRSTR
jgi:probable F420-dependent oxidoreductase